MKGAFMKRCMNWDCLGLESLVPRERDKGRGSPGTGHANPSRVWGVEMSKSQNPPPSITHLSFLVVITLQSNGNGMESINQSIVSSSSSSSSSSLTLLLSFFALTLQSSVIVSHPIIMLSILKTKIMREMRISHN